MYLFHRFSSFFQAKKPKPADPYAHLFKGKEDNGSFIPPPPASNVERACKMKEEMLRKIEKLGNMLPANTLDQLIDELGGPENVSEMTGKSLDEKNLAYFIFPQQLISQN